MKKIKVIQILCIFALALFMPLVMQGCNKNEAKLTLNQAFKVYYEVGEELNVDGGILKYVSKDGEEIFEDVKEDMVSGFTTQSAGTRTMIITFNEKTVKVTYSVFEMGLKSDIWYISNELAPGFDDRYLVMKFDLARGKFSSNSATIEDMPEYGDSNINWMYYTKIVEKEGIVLTFSEETQSGMRSQFTIKNIGNNTFSMIIKIGDETAQTYTFKKFVENN